MAIAATATALVFRARVTGARRPTCDPRAAGTLPGRVAGPAADSEARLRRDRRGSSPVHPFRSLPHRRRTAASKRSGPSPARRKAPGPNRSSRRPAHTSASRSTPPRLARSDGDGDGALVRPAGSPGGRPPARRLRLPLYSGDRLIAHLDLTSADRRGRPPQGRDPRPAGPLTAALHAFRNWTIAVTDELSGLASRRYFESRVAEEWARRERYGARLAVAIFDLDRFKASNDTLGHAAGRPRPAPLRRDRPPRDPLERLACRYGGEEFAVLFAESTSAARRAPSPNGSGGP